MYRALGPRAWSVIGLLTALFYLLDAARYYTLLRILGVRISLGLGLQLTLVTHFVSNLSPTGELAHVAVVILLMKYAVSGAVSASMSLVKSLYMTLWITLIAFVTLKATDGVRLPAEVEAHSGPVLAGLAALILFLAVFVFFPGAVRSLTARWLERPGLHPLVRKTLLSAGSTADSFAALGRSASPMHLLNHLACVAQVGVYCLLGHVIAREFGAALSPATSSAVFSNSLAVSYLAPIPGSMGVTEVATSYLMNPGMTPQGMATSLLLRFLTWYAAIVPGGLLFAEAIRRKTRVKAEASL
jgi:uncharacterized membrane protein YbhN (UPF0104 family)